MITRVLIIGSWQFLPSERHLFTFVFHSQRLWRTRAQLLSLLIFPHTVMERKIEGLFCFCQSDVSDKMYVSGMIFWKYKFLMKQKFWVAFTPHFHSLARNLPIDWPPKATLQQPKLQRVPAAKCLPLFLPHDSNDQWSDMTASWCNSIRQRTFDCREVFIYNSLLHARGTFPHVCVFNKGTWLQKVYFLDFIFLLNRVYFDSTNCKNNFTYIKAT